jgi:hypothetical protein
VFLSAAALVFARRPRRLFEEVKITLPRRRNLDIKRRAEYAKMVDGLAAIGTVTVPYPPKSAIFDGSFVQAVN